MLLAVLMSCLTVFQAGGAVVRSHLGELDDDFNVLWLPI